MHTINIQRANATFQQLEVLRRNREKRHRQRAFLVEGVRPIKKLIASNWPLQAMIYAQQRPLSDWARTVLASRHAPTHYALAPELFAQLSTKNEPGELIALAEIPPDQLDRIPIQPDLLVLVFDRPASPGNLGTLIRSCDALGAHGLIITGHATDLYDPETVSATTGSLFALPSIRLSNPRELEPWIMAVRHNLGSLQVVGSDEHGSHSIDAQSWHGPTILVLGNETWGMSAYFRQLCDSIVSIPMGGSASSLNVASAGSILLYEIARQRRDGA